MHHARCDMRRMPTCSASMPHTIHHAIHSLRHENCDMRHATRRRTICNVQHAARDAHPYHTYRKRSSRCSASASGKSAAAGLEQAEDGSALWLYAATSMLRAGLSRCLLVILSRAPAAGLAWRPLAACYVRTHRRYLAHLGHSRCLTVFRREARWGDPVASKVLTTRDNREQSHWVRERTHWDFACAIALGTRARAPAPRLAPGGR
jgi:hypothetical protein